MLHVCQCLSPTFVQHFEREQCKLQRVAKIKAVYLLLGRATERFKQRRMFVSSVESDTDETNTQEEKRVKTKTISIKYQRVT